MRPLHDGDPERIGPYRPIAALGEGPTTRVYVAATADNRPIVVRAAREDLCRTPEFRERFAQDVVAASRLRGRYTVPVLDADVEGAQLWFATAYLPGPSLAEAVAEHGPLPDHTVRLLAAGLAEALDSLHAQRLTHGRLDPACVMLAPDGPRLVDLGVGQAPAGMVTADGLVIGTVLGSPAFRSPEQLEDRPVGPAGDVFSLGSLLVFAATGAGPFGDEGTPGLAARVTAGQPYLDECPSWLRSLANACLRPDPAKRPAPSRIREALADAAQAGPGWLPPDLAKVVAQRAAVLWQHQSDPGWGGGRAGGGAHGPDAGPGPQAGAGGAHGGGAPGGSSYAAGPAAGEPPGGPRPGARASAGTRAEGADGTTGGRASATVVGDGPAEEPATGPAAGTRARSGADQVPRQRAPRAEPAAPGGSGGSGGSGGAGSAAGAAPAAAPRRRRTPRRRGVLGAAAAAAAAVVGGGVAAWVMTRGKDGGGAPAAPEVPRRPTVAGPPAAAGARKLTVWANDDVLRPDFLGDLGREFASRVQGMTIESQVLGRSPYTSALNKAFDGGSPPDVFQMDAGAVARFEAQGRLADLTPYQAKLDTDAWLPGVRAAVTARGRLVALPLYCAAPVVLYDKGLYETNQIPVPRTREEWIAGLEKLKTAGAANPAFRALLVPGAMWPVLASCLWEDGGQIAVQEGDAWRGGFDMPGSVEGARFFRHLQSYAPEAKDQNDFDGRLADQFARREVGAVIGPDNVHSRLVKANPALRGQLAAFPIPGRTAGKPAAVGVQGTVLGISSSCRDVPAAVEILALLASQKWRVRLANDGWVVPPRAGLDQSLTADNPMLRAALTALASSGHAYPVAPGWSSRPLTDLAKAVLGGADPAAAAAGPNALVAKDFGQVG